MKIDQPDYFPPADFTTADEAVDRLKQIYDLSISFLKNAFSDITTSMKGGIKYRAFYPEISIKIDRFAQIDSRLSFGHLTQPGHYATTITRPDLFENYLKQQIGLLIRNHNVPVTIGVSETPIPLHFAIPQGLDGNITQDRVSQTSLRDMFDVPELSNMNDNIVDGLYDNHGGMPLPLAPFTAQRVDYSLARLAHYTATQPEHFQNYVLFTNYQFYVSAFEIYAREQLARTDSGYTSFVATGDHEITSSDAVIEQSTKTPQMPSYHLKRPDGNGITLVNIGVGPSNAKTATDHIAVLRPHAWLMVGHCAGLRSSQNLGDFVLAHAYVREDKVLDDDLPVWVPIPALAEVQVALEQAVASVTELQGFELKKIMRTGTVATLDNRNWELRDNSGPVRRLSQSRAVALDMESATIAANGFRFRVPYGTLLCVSDKPLHGELKLPGMASEFYKSQVSRHLMIGIKAMESLQNMPLERLHSRKLRSFDQPAFL
ncbi:MAG: AMP nucleosidase [Paracoccaceae bacterium]